MSLSKDLLEFLVCPESKNNLIYLEEEQFLFCPDSRLKYRIDDGIPVMLVEEAERLSEKDCEKLVKEAKKKGLI